LARFVPHPFRQGSRGIGRLAIEAAGHRSGRISKRPDIVAARLALRVRAARGAVRLPPQRRQHNIADPRRIVFWFDWVKLQRIHQPVRAVIHRCCPGKHACRPVLGICSIIRH
jgi:hypothetical protein